MKEEQGRKLLNLGSLLDALDEIVNKSRESGKKEENGELFVVKESVRRNRSLLRETEQEAS